MDVEASEGALLASIDSEIINLVDDYVNFGLILDVIRPEKRSTIDVEAHKIDHSEGIIGPSTVLFCAPQSLDCVF